MEIQRTILLVLGLSVSLFQVVTAKERQHGNKSSKMITGIAAGLSFVIGLIVLIVTVWCCCCRQLADKRRVMPSDDPDQSQQYATSDSRPTSAGSSS